jgi:hypothetical protein
LLGVVRSSNQGYGLLDCNDRALIDEVIELANSAVWTPGPDQVDHCFMPTNCSHLQLSSFSRSVVSLHSLRVVLECLSVDPISKSSTRQCFVSHPSSCHRLRSGCKKISLCLLILPRHSYFIRPTLPSIQVVRSP